MGIRVDESALRLQVGLTGDEDRLKNGLAPRFIKRQITLTIGGGIGQSRMAMLLLHKKHIGEVQSSVWPKEMLEQYQSYSLIERENKSAAKFHRTFVVFDKIN